VAAGVAANKGSGMPVWVGEGATASGGGIQGGSGTYTATFIWLDKLGATGRWGGAGLMRQSLFGDRFVAIIKLLVMRSDLTRLLNFCQPTL
jgi:heparanase 1